MARSQRQCCRLCGWKVLAVLVCLAVGFWVFASDQQSGYYSYLHLTQAYTAQAVGAVFGQPADGPSAVPEPAGGAAGQPAPGQPAAPPPSSTAKPTVAPTSTSTTVTTTLVWHSRDLFPDPNAPRLWIIEHIDGAGHRLKSIMEGIAVAMRNKMVFGGAVPVVWGSFTTEHGHNFRTVLNEFFGGNASGVIFNTTPIVWDQKFPSIGQMEETRSSLKDGGNYYCPNPNTWEGTRDPVSKYFSAPLRRAFGSSLALRPVEFVHGKVSVALHLRRGDLDTWESRVIPNEYYYQHLDAIMAEFPQADVHLWSSLKNIMAFPKHPKWNSSHFDGFRARGVKVHLDDKTLLDPWAHMARAHILIMGQSSFSIVAGVLNMNCVIFPGSIKLPMEGWVNGKDKGKNWDRDLKDCFSRARAQAEIDAKLPPVTVKPPEPTVTTTMSPEEAAELARVAKIRESIARVSKAHAGLYTDRAKRPEFSNTVLVTGANFAYHEFYENWRCHAEAHGLDWAVIANDDEIYQKLGPERAMPVLGERVSGMHGWGSAKLDSVGRNKLVMAWEIMTLTGLDVLFSDADNVFRKDPFHPSVSIGNLIKSKQYDYIFEEELAKAPKPDHKAPGDGGNTGFFYACSRKANMKAFMLGAVAAVDEVRSSNAKKTGADQPIFWRYLTELRRSKGEKADKFGFKCVAMCGQERTCKADAGDTLVYCNMDPFHHPTGWEEPPMESASYHANYVTGNSKIAKLQKAKLWVKVDESGTCPPLS